MAPPPTALLATRLIASPVLHRAAHNPRTTSTDDDVAQSDVAAADGAVPSRLKTAARRGSCAAFDFAHLASLNKGRSIGRVSKSWAVPTGRRVRRRGRKGMGGSLRRDPDMHQLGEGHVLRWRCRRPSLTVGDLHERNRRKKTPSLLRIHDLPPVHACTTSTHPTHSPVLSTLLLHAASPRALFGSLPVWSGEFVSQQTPTLARHPCRRRLHSCM
jgi:hypothetical protein